MLYWKALVQNTSEVACEKANVQHKCLLTMHFCAAQLRMKRSLPRSRTRPRSTTNPMASVPLRSSDGSCRGPCWAFLGPCSTGSSESWRSTSRCLDAAASATGAMPSCLQNVGFQLPTNNWIQNNNQRNQTWAGNPLKESAYCFECDRGQARSAKAAATKP